MKAYIPKVKLSILVPVTLLSGFFLTGSTVATADPASDNNRTNNEQYEKKEDARKYDQRNDLDESRRGIEGTVVPETDSNSTYQQNHNPRNPSEQSPAEIMPDRN
ncbi:hypothetical protein ABO04_09010 [Nitrosomonas sp. HPC101]|uniref:hypothetical protein n=1 Tax=Nitrosomonas sp. HPC101 TaxID=1658667 RepID=UPI001367EF81|nr:hypothetical protein [Nitrosomonas sp. HPC101]MXS86038.1 hypothetical protein [Nitrosomonas sp. HPC101]